MKKKILILGKGYIGSKLQDAFDCDISGRIIHKFNEAEEEVLKYKPKILINCIGETGKSNVDDCEINRDQTLFANTFLPIMLADIAYRHKIKFVHISSGCIYHFDYPHQKPITEDRPPDFFELFYSRSKIYTEKALSALADKSGVLLVRIRIPLDSRPHPKNLLNKLIKYKTVIDVPNSITYIPDFVKAIKHLLKINAKGVYNVVNKGALRYPALMRVYKKHVPDFEYGVMKYRDFKLVRTNLVLSTRKLEKSGFEVRPIKGVLEECVKNYIKS